MVSCSKIPETFEFRKYGMYSKYIFWSIFKSNDANFHVVAEEICDS